MHSSTWLPIRRVVAASIITVCALTFGPIRLYSQVCGGYGVPGSVTNIGTEFLMCFMQNEAIGTDPSGNRYQEIYIASGGDTATVTITSKAFPKLHQVFFLQKDSSVVYRISTDPVVLGYGGDATIEVDEIVDPTVIKVVSTSPIACYGMNNKQFTADAFLALPRSVATTEYRVMGYYNSPLGGMEDMPSEFAVASFEDNDTVWITPNAITALGNDAHKQLIYVLNAGECVQVQANPSTPLLDMTGSIVRSNKPVAVFGGASRAEVPIGYSYNDAGNARTSRDHLCEEMPPLSAWGHSFVTKNFGRTHGDILRVLAWRDNTVVRINGKIWGAPLMHDTFRDYVFDLSDTAAGNVISVESDSQHTILVAMVAHSAVDQRGTGDPFLAIVPPVDQTFNDYTYFITKDFTNYYPDEQYLIVAAEQSVVNQGIYIDDSLIPAIAFTQISGALNGGKHYAAATVNQPTGGPHRIRCGDPNGFTILAYGWGDVISYGYTAGGLFKPKIAIMPINHPDPGVAPGQGGHTPELPPPGISLRNIIMEKVYFDSARIRYDQNIHNISVRLKKDISLDIGTIEPAQEKTLELTTSEPVQDVIKGTVRVWYHSRMWTDMYPVDFPFTITPQAQADVKSGSGQNIVLENYPNPVSGRTTVHFSLPQRASVSVRIFDALGRVVRTVVQSTVNAGDQQYQVKGLAVGEYTLELLAPELGVSEHRKMIVIE